ncbi:hypothetical protein [Methanonatronarchaeum sp. AMET6-2]|uniref:hypothetical protein n=1 Tax=Methanonatronarchaeum sp. AMET6-2 TaxID=2933293 RepID=UPI0012202566|nr:hypothetical protein [Methanonatronarchaeum sp. AMET6-2]RZN63376.1 MAG: hypothetical protein EF811_00575 [Methanonatronarchaeia archaeon]UOY10562.1 hypothetical protein MU439_02685 [Methanonatronarchaeum sp. AMET6-2]
MIDLVALVAGFFSALIFADGVLGLFDKSIVFKDVNDKFKIIVGLLFLLILGQNFLNITIAIG